MKLINLTLSLFTIALLFSCEDKEEAEPNSEAKLLKATCEYGDATIDTASNNIIFKVPDDADVTRIVPTFEISTNATIYPPSNVATDFSEPVLYTITSEDKTNQYVFTVSAYKAIGEITVYDCSNWTPTTTRVPLEGAKITLYSSMDDIGTTNTYDVLTTDSEAKAMLYGLKGTNYYLTIEKDNKSNIYNGYVLQGRYNTQSEVDEAMCDPNATVGGFKFKDVNQDGCVWPDDKYDFDIIWISPGITGVRQIDLYVAE